MFARSNYPAQPRTRPTWWSPEEVLELLQGGRSAPDIVKLAASECGGAVKPATLRADISVWAGSLSFGEQFQQALSRFRKDGPSGALVLGTDWYDEFYAALEDHDGDIESAAEAICIKPGVVYARMDRRNKTFYDEAFAEKVRVLEAQRYVPIRRRVLKEAASDEGDAKISMKVLESALPAFHAPRQQVDVTGSVEHEHKLVAEVVAASAARTKALLGGRVTVARVPALPVATTAPMPAVLDAELVE